MPSHGADMRALPLLTCTSHIHFASTAQDKWVAQGASPARTTITQVAFADPRWKVEIQVIAAVVPKELI